MYEKEVQASKQKQSQLTALRKLPIPTALPELIEVKRLITKPDYPMTEQEMYETRFNQARYKNTQGYTPEAVQQRNSNVTNMIERIKEIEKLDAETLLNSFRTLFVQNVQCDLVSNSKVTQVVPKLTKDC